MREFFVASRVAILLMAVAVFAGGATAQKVPTLQEIKSQEELEKTIKTLDAAIFDAYNKCELEKFASFLSDDVEFYHDKGGLMLGNAKVAEAVKQNICGKVTRELVPGSLKVYPMNGIGALEIGTHLFHHPGHEDTEGVGEGKFIHLWQYRDGAWKITRVFSYDHHPFEK